MSQDQPFPPRFRWLKRIAALVLVVVFALLGLRLWAAQVAEARLDAVLADFVARGEPVTIDDLNGPAIEDQNNAAYHMQQAMNAWPAARRAAFENWKQTESAPDPITDNRQYLLELTPVLERLRRARECERAQWQPATQAMGYWTLRPHLAESRRFARLLEDAARRHHRLGNDEQVVRLLRDLHLLAWTVDAEGQGVIDHLVAISIRAIVCGLIQDFLPTLRIAPVQGEAETGAATREQVHALIADLLDDEPRRRSFGLAMDAERVIYHDAAMQVFSGELDLDNTIAPPPLPTQVRLWILRPMYHHHLVADLAAIDHETETASLETAAPRSTVNAVDALTDQPLWLSEVRRQLFPYTSATASTARKAEAQLRLTAAALAMRMYQIDHGARPDALKTLMPDYLPHVPVDPHDPGGGPVRYVPQGVSAVLEDWRRPNGVAPLPADAPGAGRRYIVLYGIGEDQQDDGGLIVVDDAGELIERYQYGYDADNYGHGGGDSTFILEILPPPSDE